MSSATLTPPRIQTSRAVPSFVWTAPAIAIFLLAIQISPYWYPTPDSTGYLSIARNLVRHHTLRNLGSDQLYYSVGYPLLISPIFLVTDDPFLMIALVHFGLSLLLMWAIWLWARDHAPQAASWVAALSVANLSYWEAYRRTLSEVAFMTALVWLVLLLHRVRDATLSGKRWMLPAIGASLLLIFLALIRPAGILVAAGFAITMLIAAWRKQISWFRAVALTLAIGVPATLVLVALLVRDKSLAASAGNLNYLDQIRDPGLGFFVQLLEGVRLRIYEMGRLLLPGMYKSYARRGEWLNVNLLLYLPVFLAVLFGWTKLVRQRSDVLAWAFPFYLALHIIWPFDQATRFFTPLMPLFLVCLWFAMSALGKHRLRLLGCFAVVHAAVAIGYWSFDSLPHARATEARWPAVRHMATLIQEEPVQVSEMLDDTWLLLQYSLDRPVQPYRDGTTPDLKTSWLVLSANEPPPDGFVLHARLGDFQLYRRSRPPLAVSPSRRFMSAT
jgi:hypothetical protein